MFAEKEIGFLWGLGRRWKKNKKKGPSCIKWFKDTVYKKEMLLFLLYFRRTVLPANPQNGTDTKTSHLSTVIKFH